LHPKVPVFAKHARKDTIAKKILHNPLYVLLAISVLRDQRHAPNVMLAAFVFQARLVNHSAQKATIVEQGRDRALCVQRDITVLLVRRSQ